MTPYVLVLVGVLLSGGGWELRNYLRTREPFPTRVTNCLEIVAPVSGVILVVLGLALLMFR